MRTISKDDIFLKVYETVRSMHLTLQADVRAAIERAAAVETGKAKLVLDRIIENLELARKRGLPMCQDTGMVMAFISLGNRVHVEGDLITHIESAVADAYRDGFFRQSVVNDPIKERINTGTNLPCVSYLDFHDGENLKIRLLAKGFGSENCSKTYMLKPTANKEDIIGAIVETVKSAGGKPCPPTILGIGLGGTMDYSARLSKEALLEDLDRPNPDPWYASLEQEILERVNGLGIGAGGLGGLITTLGVKIKTFPTHIAGLPLAISVNCWADRKGVISI